MKTLFRAVTMLVVLVPFAAFADDKDHPESDRKTVEVLKKLGTHGDRVKLAARKTSVQVFLLNETFTS